MKVDGAFIVLSACFIGLAIAAHHESSERRALEKILAQEMSDHQKTKDTLDFTLKECGEAWLKEPVSKEWKKRLPK